MLNKVQCSFDNDDMMDTFFTNSSHTFNTFVVVIVLTLCFFQLLCKREVLDTIY